MDAYREFGSRVSDTGWATRLNSALHDSEGSLNAWGSTAKVAGQVAIGAAVVATVVEIGNAYNKATQDATKFNESVTELGTGQPSKAAAATAAGINALTGNLDSPAP